MKKILASLLCVMMVFCMMPSMVFAASTTECTDENCTHVAAITKDGTTVHFDTLAEAVAAVHTDASFEREATIEVLKDSTGSGIGFGYNTFNQDTNVTSGNHPVTITIDFNNHTYTLNKPAVGSSGTTTNGFQLLKGSTVKFMDGKIDITAGNRSIYRMFQTYANLTLENMEIDGTNQYYYHDYLIAMNCGSNNIIGNTSIYSNYSTVKPASTVLVSVYDWASGGYHGANLTINTTGTINGVVSAGGDGTAEDACGSFLKIEKGTVGGIVKDADEVRGIRTISVANGVTSLSSFANEFLSQDQALQYENGKFVVYPDSNMTGLVKIISTVDASAESSFYGTVSDAPATITDAEGKVTYYANAESALFAVKRGDTISNTGPITLKKGDGTTELGFALNNTGDVTITSGGIYDPAKISCMNGTVTITGGKFTSEPNADWISAGYKAAETDGVYSVELMNDNDAKAAGYVARYSTAASSSRKYFKTLTEGFAKYGALRLIADTKEDAARSGTIDLYCENYTFSGSLSCPGNTLYVDTGTAVLDRAECKNFYAGYSSYTADVTVKGGDVTGTVYVKKNGILTIEGGDFAGNISVTTGGTGSLTIKGGYFNYNPAAYVPDNYVVLPSDKSGYIYMVTTKPEAATDAKPAAGASAVDEGALADSDMTDEEKEAVKEVASTVKANGGELIAAANAIVEEITEEQVSQAEAAYAESEIADEGDEGEVKIYAQTYLNITPKEIKIEEGSSPVLELDIQPMYRVVASKEETAENLKVAGEIDDSETANAVVLEGSEKKLTNIKTMEVSVTLPAGFPTTDLKVKHTASSGIYYYIPTVKVIDGKNVATFTVTNGFSPFEFLVDSRSATVQFSETDTRNYTAVNVNDTLPTFTAPSGKAFGGWQFEGIDGTYMTLTDTLLTALDAKDDATIIATAYLYILSSNDVPTVQKPEITTDAGAKAALSSGGTKATITVADGYELVDVTVNGVSKGAVTELKGLKTGDKIVITTKAKKAPQTLEELKAEMAAINADNFYARSKMVTLKSGKKAVKVTWSTTSGVVFDGVEIYRSTKRYSGFGKKPLFSTTNNAFYNTSVKAGTRYYYKVRGYVEAEGEKIYTDYSTKAWRTVK